MKAHECVIMFGVLFIIAGAITGSFFQKEIKSTKIEGCEYLVERALFHRAITHKGNCKNPVHFK